MQVSLPQGPPCSGHRRPSACSCRADFLPHSLPLTFPSPGPPCSCHRRPSACPAKQNFSHMLSRWLFFHRARYARGMFDLLLVQPSVVLWLQIPCRMRLHSDLALLVTHIWSIFFSASFAGRRQRRSVVACPSLPRVFLPSLLPFCPPSSGVRRSVVACPS